ncbi:hypothetical protein VTO42DRAFT_7709 [Malbranchea cinnamomea]
MNPTSDPPSRTSTPRTFTSHAASAEDLLKSQTVGLVNLSEFRKRRAEIIEQQEKEAHDKTLGLITVGSSRSVTPSTSDVTRGVAIPEGEQAQQPPKKKKKAKHTVKVKLSFDLGEDEEQSQTTEESTETSRAVSVDRSRSKTPNGETVNPPARKITPNPNLNLPRPKVLTKAALEAEAQARDALRKEFLAIQEKVKATDILIPFVFYDGTNIPAGKVKVKKGDPIWLFLDRCRKVGAELGVAGAGGGARGRKDHRREWARVSVDDLLLVRGEVIIPHHYEFYYFIANKIPSFTSAGGLLFDYSNTAPPEPPVDNPDFKPPLEEGNADPAFTKVVDRRWYEKNKHIFPASLWREYEPGPEFEQKMLGVRRDSQGNAFFF